MSKKKTKSVLGRGLDALLGDESQEQSSKSFVSRASPALDELSITSIKANPFQPRSEFDQQALEELADSIKVHGIIQPVTVRKIGDDGYQLISGERRLQASRIAGLKTIPAYVRSADDQQMLEMSLIENIQREDLNAIEIALSYQRLISECNLKQEELGDRVGKNRTTVTNYLRLLKLPPDIQMGIIAGTISMGHARALINIDGIETQLAIYQQIKQKDLSVRQVESLVRKLLTTKKETKKTPSGSDNGFEMKHLESKLASHFGTKVELKSKSGEKGEIRIPFVSVDDLNRILEILDI